MPSFIALYITAARLVWGFKFSPTIDPTTGMPIIPDHSIETGYTSGFNVRPHPFPCDIRPRSQRVKEIMVMEKMEALEELKRFENYSDE